MKRVLLLLLLASATLPAQPPAQSSGFHVFPAGEKVLRWYGHSGRSYFIQVSDANDHLSRWSWAPLIEGGNNQEISYEVGGTGDKGFFRLSYTHQVPGPGETLESADFDGDGIANIDEINPPFPWVGQTDPLKADTDGDGVDDLTERDWNLDPTNPADAGLMAPSSTLTYLQHYQNGSTPPNLGGNPGNPPGGPPPTPVEIFENTSFALIPLGTSQNDAEITDQGQVRMGEGLWQNGTLDPSRFPYDPNVYEGYNSLNRGGYYIRHTNTAHPNWNNLHYIGRLDPPGIFEITVPVSITNEILAQHGVSYSPSGGLIASADETFLFEDGSSLSQHSCWQYFLVGSGDSTWETTLGIGQWLWTSPNGVSQAIAGYPTIEESSYTGPWYRDLMTVGGMGEDAFIVARDTGGGPDRVVLFDKHGQEKTDLSAKGFAYDGGMVTSRNGHLGQGREGVVRVYHTKHDTMETLGFGAWINDINDLGDVLCGDTLARKFTDPGTGAVTWAKRVLNDELLPAGWSGLQVNTMTNTMPLERQQALEAINAYPPAPDEAPVPMLTGTALLNGQRQKVMLVPVSIAVDSNRDGEITFDDKDDTTQEKPFRFWVNNDQDDSEADENVYVNAPDSADKILKTRRDLEDFSRLWLRLDGLHDAIVQGQILVGLKWQNTAGTSPSINIFRHVESDGGTKYLTETATATQQVPTATLRYVVPNKDSQYVSVAAGAPFVFHPQFWQGLSSTSTEKYLLFEACAEGKGQLALTLHKPDGSQIGEGPGVWMELKDIKKMYVRSSGNQFDGPSWDETDDTIVFVHGWRMSPEGRSAFAETFYKRLWHRGFKGRYAAFQWNTYHSDSWQWLPRIGGGIDAYLARYNDSEKIAWDSAQALKTFVNQLPGTSKHVAAHSMGNITTSEAIRLGMNVNNYAMMQAAVACAAYDVNEGRTKQTGSYYHYTFAMWDKQTPDDDSDPVTRSLAYRGRFKDIGSSTNLVSFFLPLDYATYMPWEVNNDQAKPEGGFFAANFRYKRNNPSGQKLYKYNSVPHYVDGNVAYIDEVDYYLTDPYEAMSYACSSWGKALGAQNAAQGAISGQIDLTSAAYQLPGEDEGFGDEHSGQFNANIQELKTFYNTLLNSFFIPVNP